MPDISQAMLPHWCVVWRRSDTKTKFGKARVRAPINVKCQWIVDDQNNSSQEITRENYPRSVPVNREIPLGSYVWGPGRIGDVPSSPTYWEVKGYSKTPDINGNYPVYRIILIKASQTLPEVV